MKNQIAKLSLGFLLTMGLLTALAPWIAPHSYSEIFFEHRLSPPSSDFWLGTDALGRDLLSRLLYGGQLSLALGLATSFFALMMGTMVGAVSGYWGGWIDRVLIRFMDAFAIFPSALIAILLMILLGKGFLGIFLSLALTTWVFQARLTRSLVIQTKALDYVESARGLGVPRLRILFVHIFPNLWPSLLTSLLLLLPQNILMESFLSFIGLGLEPPYASWGALAHEGFRAMREHPHLLIFPGMTLFLTLLAFQGVGLGLRNRS